MSTKKILFVCMGNICRSPSAEAVFNAKIKKKNLMHKYMCDSAGTIAYHSGQAADARMKKHAIKRGYDLTSIARKVDVMDDFETFDLIIGMDEDNMLNLSSMAWTATTEAKLHTMTSFCKEFEYTSVPDPYYGGEQGFELVLDLLEDACDGLIEFLENE